MNFIRLHKRPSIIVVVLVLVIGVVVYRRVSTGSVPTRYVLAATQKGTLVVSVSGTGQVSASNQLDLKPQASGTVIAIRATEGQTLKTGVVIMQLDARDALKAVRDAQANLDSARLSLEKIKKPADALSRIQTENALAAAQQSKTDAETKQITSYEDGFNAVSGNFLEIPDVVSGLNDMLTGTAVSGAGQSNAYAYADLISYWRSDSWRFRDSALAAYTRARAAYDPNLLQYKATSRAASRAEIEALISDTADAVRLISDAVKETKNFIDLVNDTLVAQGKTIPAILGTHRASLQRFTTTVNTHLDTIAAANTALVDARQTIETATRTISEKQAALAKLDAGADPLDISSAELTVRQRENALRDAREKLDDYSIRAPFEGVVAKISVKRGESAGTGTAAVTFISAQRLAEISLNEVDVAKVAAGNKATLTFDAVPGLTISGVVASVDTLGVVSQGVVTYAVKIGFDTEDVRVRPGMSVSAAIIIDVKSDVLLVPAAAVKSRGEERYVEVVDQPPGTLNPSGVTLPALPRQQTVSVGLTNDTQSEIVSGITEGAVVVARTITSATGTSGTTQAPSLFGAPGRGASGGGAGFRNLR